MDVFLDLFSDFEISDHGNLPHLHQDGKMQWITMRMADSLPQSIISLLVSEREEFMRRYADCQDKALKIRQGRLFNEKVNNYIDAGYGLCPFNDVQNRDIFIASLEKYNHDKYVVEGFVIMPNHVHMLITLLSESKLSEVLKQIKGSSAFAINKNIGRSGKLWQKESFDRAVRSEDHMKYCINYMLDNPRNLNKSQFTIYMRSTPGYPLGPNESKTL